jgi:dolichol-phosphate mannosyltransferase
MPTPLSCVLVMPAYNEQECISPVVQAWYKEFQTLFGSSFRMIVVNDGSRDRTGDILDGLSRSLSGLTVIHQKNGGHGVALLTGYRAAAEIVEASFVFHVDSDDQFRTEDFRKLWDQRQKSKFILGWRAARHDALHRLVITRILRMAIFAVFGVWLKDSNVPFRLIESRYLAALLKVMPDGVFAPNIFLAILAAKDGQDLMHIPVHHEDRKTGTVSIVRWKLIKVCFRSLQELFQFRIRLKGKVNTIRLVQQSPYVAVK